MAVVTGLLRRSPLVSAGGLGLLAGAMPQESEAGVLGKVLDMSLAARMARAREMGFDYVRATRNGPANEVPWTMYKHSGGDINSTAETLASIYGPNVYLARADDAVDVSTIQKDIVRALREAGVHAEYGPVARLAREAAPEDIVSSAGLWDNQDLVQIVWDKVLEPKEIVAVKTPDGLIRFDNSGTRSIHAAFDPAKASSSDLLAGVAPWAVAGGLGLLAGAMPGESRAAKLSREMTHTRPSIYQDPIDARLQTAQYMLQGAGMIPAGYPITDLAGAAGDVLMYYRDPSSRTWGNYAQTAAGLLPFIP